MVYIEHGLENKMSQFFVRQWLPAKTEMSPFRFISLISFSRPSELWHRNGVDFDAFHLLTMPISSRSVLSLCMVTSCAIRCASSFILTSRAALPMRSISLLTPTVSHRISWQLFGRKGVGNGNKEKKPSKSNLPEKICVVCGRPFTWRKKWERCWDEVTCCSKSCNAQRRGGK